MGVPYEDKEERKQHSKTVKDQLFEELANRLRILNQNGDDIKSGEPVDKTTLSGRMQEYKEEFFTSDRVVMEEFDLEVTVSWVNDQYMAKVDLEEDDLNRLKTKYDIPEPPVHNPILNEAVLLPCGTDKDKVIPLAIKQVESLSLWLGKVK
jgi:hypothetical protein